MATRRRFTLVELMIVVAIIGILAAIAIPSFATMQLRARAAEAVVNVDGIMMSLLAASAESPLLQVTANWRPDERPGKTLRPFNASGALWEDIAFEPDGFVRCSYRANTAGGVFGSDGACDLDEVDYHRVVSDGAGPDGNRFGNLMENACGEAQSPNLLGLAPLSDCW